MLMTVVCLTHNYGEVMLGTWCCCLQRRILGVWIPPPCACLHRPHVSVLQCLGVLAARGASARLDAAIKRVHQPHVQVRQHKVEYVQVRTDVALACRCWYDGL